MMSKLFSVAFAEEIMKKRKGLTLIEVLLALMINVAIVMLMCGTYRFWTIIQRDSKSRNLISAYESLMYMDYYIKTIGEKVEVKDNCIDIFSSEDKKDIILKKDDELRIYYMDSSVDMKGNKTYTYQPILYDVKEFTVSQRNNVLEVKIEMEDGLEVKKTIGEN